MRTWLLLIALVAGACSDDTTCDDCFGTLDLTWTFRASSGGLVGCPALYANAEVTVSPTEGRDIVERFPCGPQVGQLTLEGGPYDVVIAMIGSDGAELARSESQRAQVPILGQRVVVGWELSVP